MSPSPQKHFTREPWWVIPLAAAVMAIVPIWKYFDVQRVNTTHLSLPVLVGAFALAGAAGSSILVFRSHIRSRFWSNFALLAGMIVIALAVCAMCFLLSA